jgi:hypothetical protein
MTKNKFSLLQKIKEFGKNETKKLTVPRWAVEYGNRIDIHELRIADAIAERELYNFFYWWLKVITTVVLAACLVMFFAFNSVRGMIITLPDAMYVPLTSDGQLVKFEDLARELPQEKIKGFLENCLEGMYSLNSLSYQKTFKLYSNRCFSRTKQQKLAMSVVQSNLYEFIGGIETKTKSDSRARMVSFDVTEIKSVGKSIADAGYMQYGFEVRGKFTKYDMATRVKQVAPATFQVVLRNVVPFANESELTIMSARLKWDRQTEVVTNEK